MLSYENFRANDDLRFCKTLADILPIPHSTTRAAGISRYALEIEGNGKILSAESAIKVQQQRQDFRNPLSFK